MKAAFGRLIEQRYPGATGYWTCPAAQQLACLGEVRVGARRHLVAGQPTASGGSITFTNVYDRSWVRRWSAYSTRFTRGFETPGVESVNGGYFDWPFLVAGAYDGWRRGKKAFAATAYDGPVAGLRIFYRFRCTVRAALVTCANALGDSMRYSPRGAPATG